ncbi:sesquipedalian-1 isoform X2 [Ischnura elegans]|uniref:sesquipedalian-1 isoform X2 n=1 Tax=Ischnura elegans TaxID=197161 RepID=UPI001ED8756C|nr:sesquipedalian-1 isoform X2 [Ischnura elegans]
MVNPAMKINEKNLAAFATSATPVDREGWLVKRGEVNKYYQRRWFVLKGNLLFYFEKRGDKEPVGLIILEGCTIELAENEEQYGFKIVFHGSGNRSYLLGAESQESMEAWMKALACASYDYLKVLVADLQRQLEEAEEQYALGVPNMSDMNSACGPQAPPRHRHNPFNKPMDPVEAGNYGDGTSAILGRSQAHRMGNSYEANGMMAHMRPRNFRSLHREYGQSILKDQLSWKAMEGSARSSEPSKTEPKEPPPNSENLLISL